MDRNSYWNGEIIDLYSNRFQFKMAKEERSVCNMCRYFTEVDFSSFLRAIASDFQISQRMVLFLCDLFPKKSHKILSFIRCSTWTPLFVCNTVTDEVKQLFLQDAIYNFNPANPTKNYDLDLKQPPEYYVAYIVMLINKWDENLAKYRVRNDPDSKYLLQNGFLSPGCSS